MNGVEQRSLRGNTASARPRPTRPSTSISVGEGARINSSSGSALSNIQQQQQQQTAQPPVQQLPSSASVPHGPALSLSGDHTLSSSIALSSDTASLSLDASGVPGLLASTVTLSTSTAVRREVPPPLWWDASSSLLAGDSGVPATSATAATAVEAASGGADFSGGSHGGAAKLGGTTGGGAAAPSASSSLLPPEWRCSIDFSHEIESRAEAELQQLWTTLWTATHSEAALAAALAGPRTHWNPYRPTRGGQEVREEVLNSEVAEFAAMIPTDSLYVHGSAVRRETHAAPQPPLATTAGDVAAAHLADAALTTSPHRPPHRSRKPLPYPQLPLPHEAASEEVLMLDRSSAEVHPPTLHTIAAALGEEAGAEAHYTEAWWTARRADAEAALFRYLWEAVVVPFYATAPALPATLPFPTLGLATATAGGADASASLTLTRSQDAKEEKDERDASGMVMAFWPSQTERRHWALESAGLRSSSPSCAQTPLSAAEGASSDGRPPSPLARTQRTGGAACGGGGGANGTVNHGGLPFHPTHDHDVVSDDSLEVEVLDDNDGRPEWRGSLTEEGAERGARSPARANREHTAGPVRMPPAQRTVPRRHERPSTAGVQAAMLSPIDDIDLNMPIPVSRNGAAAAARQRARSARTDDVATFTQASSPTHQHQQQQQQRKLLSNDSGSGDGRGWRWTKTPTLHTTLPDSPADVKLTAPPLPKAASATRQRPPTAQPPASKNRRGASPKASGQPAETAGALAEGGKKGKRAVTDNAAEVEVVSRSAAGVESDVHNSHSNSTSNNNSASSASPSGRRKTTRGNALRAQRPPRQFSANTNTSVSGPAASHALQLLELRSRSTARSPYVQRIPSPCIAAGHATHYSSNSNGSGGTSGGGAGAEAPRQRRRTRASPQLEEPPSTSDGRTPQRRGRLSPVTTSARPTPAPTAAVPQEKRRRHAHGVNSNSNNNDGVHVTNHNKSSNTTPAYFDRGGSATASTSAHGEGEKREKKTPATFALDGSEKLVSKARLAPLQETAAHSAATPQERPSMLGRTPSVKARRGERETSRASSPDGKRTGLQRPTTAQR